MEFKEALESLKLKFTSGNKIKVDRATILRTEWEALLPVLNNTVNSKEKLDDIVSELNNSVNTINKK